MGTMSVIVASIITNINPVKQPRDSNPERHTQTTCVLELQVAPTYRNHHPRIMVSRIGSLSWFIRFQCAITDRHALLNPLLLCCSWLTIISSQSSPRASSPVGSPGVQNSGRPSSPTPPGGPKTAIRRRAAADQKDKVANVRPSSTRAAGAGGSSSTMLSRFYCLGSASTFANNIARAVHR